MILKNRNRFECFQKSIIFVYYFWKSFCSRRISNRISRSYKKQISFYTQISVSFYTFWSMIKTFYITSCCENFAMISKLTIAMQYNLHMNHVNRANQLRNELTISRFEQVKWTKRINELLHTSFEIIINHRRISVIEIDVYLLRNWLQNFYEIQISYINRQSVSNRSIVCEVIVRSIFTRNLENVKHSFSEMSTYNIVRVVERLIIVWHVKWIYACHLNASKSIMIRKECHTNALINSESEYVSRHLKIYRWFQMNFECNQISVIECLYIIELFHWIIHIYT